MAAASVALELSKGLLHTADTLEVHKSAGMLDVVAAADAAQLLSY